MSALTLQQKQFIEEYLVDWSPTKAYKRVFPNALDANNRAQAWLATKPVKEYLKERVNERNAQLRIDQTFVIDKLLSVVQSDYTEFLCILDLEDIRNFPEELRVLVQGTKKKVRILEDGTREETYEVQFMNKDRAIDLLGKHVGAFAKDNERTLNHRVKGFAELVKDLEDKLADE